MYPRLRDDGRKVELDLHGATLAEADTIIRNTVRLAATRGRDSLNIIHGLSSSEADALRPTIKRLLYDFLESGELALWVADWVGLEGSVTIALAGGADHDPRPISIRDVD